MSNQFAALAAAALSLSAGLMNSPQTIDHAQALRGGVTPLDAPGYPVTISRPGHYRLSGDLVVPAHADGILITAPDVTLDLNGHTVRGPVRCAHSPQGRTVECNWLIEPSLRSGISTVAAPRTIRSPTATVRSWSNRARKASGPGRGRSVGFNPNHAFGP